MFQNDDDGDDTDLSDNTDDSDTEKGYRKRTTRRPREAEEHDNQIELI